jgi:hypothetical protein
VADRRRSRDDIEQLAATAIARISGAAARAIQILRWSVLIAACCGVVAYVLGWFAVDDPWPAYAVVAIPLTAAPAAIAALGLGRVRTVIEGAPTLVADLRLAAVDPEVRRRLAALVQRSSGGGWRRARDLWRLRRDVIAPGTSTLDLWLAVLALARLPWLLAATAIGCALLLLWSLVAVVMLLV